MISQQGHHETHAADVDATEEAGLEEAPPVPQQDNSDEQCDEAPVDLGVNDGKCNVVGCCNPVFIACQSCYEFLCYDHSSSACSVHGTVYTLPADFVKENYITVIVGETGKQFQAPIENETDDVNAQNMKCNCDISMICTDVNEPDLEFNVLRELNILQVEEKNPDLYQRNIQRKNRLHGLPYKKYRGVPGSDTVPAKAPQTSNCSKCRFKCNENFPENVREAICRDFYKLGDYSRQKDYIVSHIVEVTPRYRLLSSNKPHKTSRVLTIFLLMVYVIGCAVTFL